MQFDGLFLLVGVKRGNVEDFIPGITADQPYLGVSKKTGKPEAYYIGKFKIDLESRFFV